MPRRTTFRGAATLTGLVGVFLPLTLSSTVAEVASTAPRYDASTSQSEATALRSAHWMANVAISIGKGSWTFKSAGVPPTKFVASYYAVPSNPAAVSAAGARIMATKALLKNQNYDYTLPLTPVYTKKTTVANMGPIGIALDGAAFYNPYEQNHTTVATADNFIATSGSLTASFLDDCDGHPGPNGEYHYHGLPTCLVAYATGERMSGVGPVTSIGGSKTAAVSLGTAAARKPVLLGFAFDGYGIYDNIAMNGKTVPVSALDACNGIFSPVPGYPHGVYHYVLENIKGARADIGCYHGVVSSAYTKALQATLGTGGGVGQSPGGGPGSSASGGASTRPSSPPPSGGPPHGDAARSSAGAKSARSLAADSNEDNLLRAVVAVSGNNDCG